MHCIHLVVFLALFQPVDGASEVYSFVLVLTVQDLRLCLHGNIFNQKEHCFIVVFNMCLHGNSEIDHKSTNGLQSEVFQKRVENDL